MDIFDSILNELKDPIKYLNSLSDREAKNSLKNLITIRNLIKDELTEANGRIRQITTLETIHDVKSIYEQEEIPNAKLSALDEEDRDYRGEGITPLPHQIDHINKELDILNFSFFVVDNSKMGTGKTFTTAYIENVLNIPNMLVISPATLVPTWEMVTELAELPIVVLDNDIDGIISYEKLRGRGNGIQQHGLIEREEIIEEFTDKRGKKHINKDITFTTTELFDELIMEGCLIVFDEYHRIKNITSALHHCVKAIILRLKYLVETKKAKSKVILLSGSPFVQIDEVINFCKVVGIITAKELYKNQFGRISMDAPNFDGALQMVNFCKNIDKNKTNKVLLDFPMEKNIKSIKYTLYKLYNEIISPIYSSTMPDANITVPLDVKNGFYQLSQLRIPYLQKAISDLSKVVKDIQEKTMRSKAEMQKAMGAVIKQLYIIEYQKIEVFIRLAIQTLEKYPNCKVALIFNFTLPLNICYDYLEKYNPMVLNGQVSIKDRTKIVRLFNQPNNNHRLLLGNLTVCSLGIDLHDTDGNYPRYVFIDGSYNVINSHQCVYRFYRAGTMSIPHVRFVYIDGEGNNEINILESYARKGTILKETLAEQVISGVKFPSDYEGEIESNKVKLFKIEYPITPLEKHDIITFDDEPDEHDMVDLIKMELFDADALDDIPEPTIVAPYNPKKREIKFVGTQVRKIKPQIEETIKQEIPKKFPGTSQKTGSKLGEFIKKHEIYPMQQFENSVALTPTPTTEKPIKKPKIYTLKEIWSLSNNQVLKLLEFYTKEDHTQDGDSLMRAILTEFIYEKEQLHDKDIEFFNSDKFVEISEYSLEDSTKIINRLQ